MKPGAFVGRVGALALTLGIGYVLTAGVAGPAHAEPGDSQSTTGPSAAGADSTTGPGGNAVSDSGGGSEATGAPAPRMNQAPPSTPSVSGQDRPSGPGGSSQLNAGGPVQDASAVIADEDDEVAAADQTADSETAPEGADATPAIGATNTSDGLPKDDKRSSTPPSVNASTASEPAPNSRTTPVRSGEQPPTPPRTVGSDESTSVTVVSVPSESPPVAASSSAEVDGEDAPPPPAAPSFVTAVATVLTGLAGPDTAPTAPGQSPLGWTLLGFARRDIGQSSDDQQSVPGLVDSSDPVDRGATSELSPPATSTATVESAVQGGPDARETNMASLTPTPPLTWTGQPSLIHQIVAFVLKLAKPLLTIFDQQANALLNGIPFISDGVPPFYLTSGLNVARSEFEGSPVWTLTPENPTGKQVVAVHGGAYFV